MAKQKEDQEADDARNVSLKEISRDLDNGIVVYKTDAPDGTGFTLDINGREITSAAQDGQVWFYAGSAIGQNPAIRLV